MYLASNGMRPVSATAAGCTRAVLIRPVCGRVCASRSALPGKCSSVQRDVKAFSIKTDDVLDTPKATTASQPAVTWAGFKQALGISVATAVGGAVVAMYINQFSNTSCVVTSTCSEISDVMKAFLVATHLYTFLLVPAAMYVFYDKIDELKHERARSPFVAMLGLSFIMVAIMGEIGWHIEQDWYYKEEYNILNMGFYFFLCSGLSAWAFGLRLNTGSDAVTLGTAFVEASKDTSSLQSTFNEALNDKPAGFSLADAADRFLIAVPALTLALYGLGAAAIHSKVPIYIEMTFIFAALTYRFWQVLRTPKVLLFPLFSVGVNLTFIALLNKYQTDAFLNPLFHILHDAAGTEMGILIIAVLTYMSPALAETGEGAGQAKTD